MNTYAVLINNVVVKVATLTSEQFIQEVKLYEIGFDITDQIPRPEVNWILEGNQLKVASDTLTQEEMFLIQCTKQRVFGQNLAWSVVDAVGARNLLLVSQGTPVDVTSLMMTLKPIQDLLMSGALKTARTATTATKANFPLYLDIFDKVIAEISLFLEANNY